mmetsp:Transcript_49326/g.130383  ORF Transcript_49326/g.130383 Transcript_49326/m.130383 type:complete len:211 (-) Transcript_49326:55-687(-)
MGAEALGCTVVGRSDRGTCVQLQQLCLLKPLGQQRLHLAVVVRARPPVGDQAATLRLLGHHALAREAAHGAQQPAGLRKESLLGALEHLGSRLSPHGRDEHLKGLPLLVEALPQLVGRLGEPVEGGLGLREVRVLVGVEGARELAVGVGHVGLAVAAEVGAAETQHGSGAKDAAILRADAQHLVSRIAYQDLLLLVRLLHGLAQPSADGR